MDRVGGKGLYDRDSEVALLAELLERAGRGEGTVTLVDGPAGIGKTRLLQETRRRARQAGLRALTARCAELECDFAYGVARQLFEPELSSIPPDQRDAVLGGAAQGALTLLQGPSDPSANAQSWQPDVIMTNLHALYWLTSNLAERGPLLLVVDDCHWSDRASLRFLDFLARRIDELPVALLLALRWADAGDDAGLLTAISTHPTTTRLALRPIGPHAVRSVLAATLGHDPDASFTAACHTVTGGNPFLLGELVAELHDRGIPPTPARVPDVLRLGPPSIARALELRLARLPPEAGILAGAVAILGDDVSPAVAVEFCGLTPEAVGRASDALTGCGVFAEDGSLAFQHSIQRAAVHAGLTRSDRAQRHRRAADLLVRHDAAPEQIAAHLLLCDPLSQSGSVAVLRQAAAVALTRGVPDVAATYLRRALAEPPPPALRSDVLIELCVAEARSPEASSFGSLRIGLDLLEDPRQRAEVAVEVARGIAMVADMGTALEILDQAIRDLADLDEALSLRLQAEFVSVARLYPATRADAMDRLRQLRSAATPDNLAGSILLANLAMERIEEGDLVAAVDFAGQALRDGMLLAEERWMFAYAANALTWSDQTREAERAWTEVLGQARSRGSVTMLHLAAIWRSHLALRCGLVGDAEADARVGLNVCRERAWTYSRSYAVAFLVDALVERSQLDAADRVIDENPSPHQLHYRLASLGRLRCAQGRFAEGLELFLRCGAELGAQGENPSVIAWRSGAALAALQLGQRERARQLADEEVALARAFGAASPLGISLRARALIEEGGAQIEGLEEAVDVLARSPARLEQARAIGDLGAALRRAGRRADAEVQLRVALERAHQCGGTEVRDRAREELLRSGLRPRRFATSGTDALTPSERRVAALAVGGLGNREVAQSLFVSLKTVEAHLSSVYRKLGVSARWQLAELLAADQQSASLTI